jgi:hypothetical protein
VDCEAPSGRQDSGFGLARVGLLGYVDEAFASLAQAEAQHSF